MNVPINITIRGVFEIVNFSIFIIDLDLYINKKIKLIINVNKSYITKN